jgi:hypothetical protein
VDTKDTTWQLVRLIALLRIESDMPVVLPWCTQAAFLEWYNSAQLTRGFFLDKPNLVYRNDMQ